MELSLLEIQQATGAELTGPVTPAQAAAMRVIGYSIDSRHIEPGDLFFAIKGEHFNGHSFIDQTFERSAVAAIASEMQPNPSCPVLIVEDTIQALHDLARYARGRWNKPVIAVTGSAGKTSTKEIIASLLGTRFRTAKNPGNLNNHLGLPLALLRIPEAAEVAVVEMGMNHAGEIRALAEIARPRVGVVTNVGYAHIEFFSSIDEIAAAKRELIEALTPDGIAVLNADDPRVAKFRHAHKGKVLTYGFSPEADLRATTLDNSAFEVNGVGFHTQLTGTHAISNILAGLAVAQVFDIPPPDLREAVARLLPGKMRGESYVKNGVTILDDSYNSNPEAARAMLDVLLAQSGRRKIAVLGEMLELGHWAETLHRDLGRYAAEHGVDVLIGVRGASRLMVQQAVEAGMGSRAALFFEDPESAGDFLHNFVEPGDAVLFKGSRGTHVEFALARLIDIRMEK